MLFLFRSAPEVEKRIHSKWFRKFWEEPGYRRANLRYCSMKVVYSSIERAIIQQSNRHSTQKMQNFFFGFSTFSFRKMELVFLLRKFDYCSMQIVSNVHIVGISNFPYILHSDQTQMNSNSCSLQKH